MSDLPRPSTLVPPPAAAPPLRRAALLRSPAFLGHDTGGHPEGPRRIAAIDAALAAAGLLDGRPEVAFGPSGLPPLARVHDPAYLEALEAFARGGGGYLDADTIVRPDSWAVALLAAGAAVAATDAVLDGAVNAAFALVRPPGHHASPRRGMGFCLLNNVAVAAAHALARGLERVLIVDWDVHHGNGTQDAFWDSDRVLFASLHQWPLYPGTGAADERGAGAGAGYTINVPLPPGTGDAAYLAALDARLLPAARAFHPDLVIVSAGFDAHAADPLANLRLTEAGFAEVAKRVADLAAATAGGRLVAVLEGGYDPGALGRSVAAVVRAIDGADEPAAGRHHEASIDTTDGGGG